MWISRSRKHVGILKKIFLIKNSLKNIFNYRLEDSLFCNVFWLFWSISSSSSSSSSSSCWSEIKFCCWWFKWLIWSRLIWEHSKIFSFLIIDNVGWIIVEFVFNVVEDERTLVGIWVLVALALLLGVCRPAKILLKIKLYYREDIDDIHHHIIEIYIRLSLINLDKSKYLCCDEFVSSSFRSLSIFMDGRLSVFQ